MQSSRPARLALLLLSACSFRSEVPSGANIHCRAGQDCPAGWVCVPQAQRCVRQDSPALATPQLANPGLSPTLGRVGTTFELGFDLTGTLGGPPSARALGPGGASLDFLCSPCATGQRCSCLLRPAPGAPDGTYQVQVQAADALGLPVPALPAGALTLKSTPPPPPDTGPEVGLHLLRAPWGARPAIGAFRLTLDSLGPALAEAGTLVVYGDADRRSTLASVAVQPGPLPALELPAPDRAQVWVDLIDGAGNAAPGGPFLVRNVTWVATLGHKAAGDTVLNPHACYGRGVQGPALLQGDDPQHELDAQSGPTGGPEIPPVTGAGRWRERRVGTPALVDADAPSLDVARGELVTYGAGSYSTDQTWRFDGTDWRRSVNSGAGPDSDNFYPAMAYDARRGRMVLYGDGPRARRCWTWELAGDTWGLAATGDALPDGGGPPDGGLLPDGGPWPDSCPAPGPYATLTYDSARRRVVMLDEQRATWAWDGQAWSRLVGDGTRPELAATLYGSLAWQGFADGGGQLVSAGGGEDDAGAPVDSNGVSVGAWRGDGYHWSTPFPSDCAAGKPGCYAQLVIAEPTSGEVLLAAEDDSENLELWRWGGDPARPFQPVRGLPSGHLRGLALASPGPDGAPRVLVISGEDTTSRPPSLDNTWRCSLVADAGCQLLHGPQTLSMPTARETPALAFSPAGVALMYGGRAARTGLRLDDTWRWTGDDWEHLNAGQPGPRSASALAWYPPWQTYLLFGGGGVDAGLNGSTTPAPAVRTDVWVFNGFAWTLVADNLALLEAGAPAATTVPGLGVLVADPTLSLLAQSEDGGLGLYALGNPAPAFYGDLVTSAGGQIYAVASPTAAGTSNYEVGLYSVTRYGEENLLEVDNSGDLTFSSEAYDDAAGRLLLFGTSQVRAWDGQGLVPVPTANPEGTGSPPARRFPGTAYDPVRGRSLLFGGNDLQGGELGDTWEFDLAGSQPAEVCRFNLDSAGLPAGLAPSHLRVEVQAGAGHTADQSGGATLLLWQQGRWQGQARCDAGDCTLSRPAELAVDLDGAQAELLLGDLGLLGLAVVPDATNGAGASLIRVPEAQVTMDYRLP